MSSIDTTASSSTMASSSTTASSSLSTVSSISSSHSNHSAYQVGTIVGSVTAGLASIVALVLAFFLWRLRRRQSSANATAKTEDFQINFIEPFTEPNRLHTPVQEKNRFPSQGPPGSAEQYLDATFALDGHGLPNVDFNIDHGAIYDGPLRVNSLTPSALDIRTGSRTIVTSPASQWSRSILSSTVAEGELRKSERLGRSS